MSKAELIEALKRPMSCAHGDGPHRQSHSHAAGEAMKLIANFGTELTTIDVETAVARASR